MSRTALVSFKIIYLLCTAFLVGLAANIQMVKADYAWTKTIYIRADGSVEPSAAPISVADNVTYTLTDNIGGDVPVDSSAIIIQRDNIVVDGAGYTLQSTEASNSKGIDLTGRSNVTIKNMKITAFSQGILLSSSNNNTLSGNSIIANKGDGVVLYSSSNNSIVGNMFAGCGLHTVESHGNEVEGNTVNGRPLVYLESISDFAVEDAGQVILVNCNNIQVENLNLSNVTIGVELWKTSNTKITNNNITANHWYGILLLRSDNNSVSGNNITNSGEYGIWLISSSSNVISGNNITANDKYGIALSDSPNTTLTSNILADNKYNLAISGSWLPDFLNYVDESNSVDSKPVYYWVNLQDMTVPLDAGYVALVNCTHIAVQDLNLTKSGIGILLAFTTNSTITKTNVANSGAGISLFSSSNNDIYQNNLASNELGISLIESSGNSIYKNNVTNCSHGIRLDGCGSNSISGNNIADNEFGIYLVSSNENVFGNNVVDNGVGIFLIFAKNNVIFHNNFIGNGQQASVFYWESWGNVWDDGYPSGGNYWSDYNGTDLNSGPYQNETGYDWIGDSPHNADKYPLMHPFESGAQETEVAYRNLLGYYNNLLVNFSTLDASYQQHLSDYSSLQQNHTALQNNFNELLTEFNTLNTSYQQHLLNHTALQTNYGDLQEAFNSLNTSYLSLNSSYQALNASYNNLDTSFKDYQQTTQNELANIKNLLYVFIAITVILAAALAYVATRKPKTKPET